MRAELSTLTSCTLEEPSRLLGAGKPTCVPLDASLATYSLAPRLRPCWGLFHLLLIPQDSRDPVTR
jgi:hypothetical protein